MHSDAFFPITHSEQEWNIGNKNCLAWNISQTYDICIPLDFLKTPIISKKPKKAKKSGPSMVFKLKLMAFPTKITPYDPYQLKKL